MSKSRCLWPDISWWCVWCMPSLCRACSPRDLTGIDSPQRKIIITSCRCCLSTMTSTQSQSVFYFFFLLTTHSVVLLTRSDEVRRTWSQSHYKSEQNMLGSILTIPTITQQQRDFMRNDGINIPWNYITIVFTSPLFTKQMSCLKRY